MKCADFFEDVVSHLPERVAFRYIEEKNIVYFHGRDRITFLKKKRPYKKK